LSLFSDLSRSQGSVATALRCGEIFKNNFVAILGLLVNYQYKNFDNRLAFGEVADKSPVSCFLVHIVFSSAMRILTLSNSAFKCTFLCGEILCLPSSQSPQLIEERGAGVSRTEAISVHHAVLQWSAAGQEGTVATVDAGASTACIVSVAVSHVGRRNSVSPTTPAQQLTTDLSSSRVYVGRDEIIFRSAYVSMYIAVNCAALVFLNQNYAVATGLHQGTAAAKLAVSFFSRPACLPGGLYILPMFFLHFCLFIVLFNCRPMSNEISGTT